MTSFFFSIRGRLGAPLTEGNSNFSF